MNKKDKSKLTKFLKGELKNINLNSATTKDIIKFLDNKKNINKKNKGGLLVTPKLAQRGF
jgi:predicted transcriptional regulator